MNKMKVNLAVCTVIALSLILCPAAALVKSPPAVAETTVIQSAEDGSYISVMSASNGNVERMKLREYVIGSVAAEMPAVYHPQALMAQAVEEKILYGYKDVHGNPPHTEIVDTGRLFDSIDADVRRESQNAFTVSVGANTPYAIYVHEGTYKLKGRAFITDAVTGKSGEVQSILAGELPKGIT
jgi:HK97 gp10 family phage protein